MIFASSEHCSCLISFVKISFNWWLDYERKLLSSQLILLVALCYNGLFKKCLS